MPKKRTTAKKAISTPEPKTNAIRGIDDNTHKPSLQDVERYYERAKATVAYCEEHVKNYKKNDNYKRWVEIVKKLETTYPVLSKPVKKKK